MFPPELARPTTLSLGSWVRSTRHGVQSFPASNRQMGLTISLCLKLFMLGRSVNAAKFSWDAVPVHARPDRDIKAAIPACTRCSPPSPAQTRPPWR